MIISPFGGKPAEASMLANVLRFVATYYPQRPDPSLPQQMVALGTSRQRDSVFERSFSKSHILAVNQAISPCERQYHIDGPLLLGMNAQARLMNMHAGVSWWNRRERARGPRPNLRWTAILWNRSGRKAKRVE